MGEAQVGGAFGREANKGQEQQELSARLKSWWGFVSSDFFSISFYSSGALSTLNFYHVLEDDYNVIECLQ